eukprot:scaffold1560_cov146-Skeletonema_dohrnii-CCMP3373.AAC.3
MVRTAGASDKNQRTRRTATDAEKRQSREKYDATKKKTIQKEKNSTAHRKATFFQPHGTKQKRSDDNNDVNDSNGGVDDSLPVDRVINDSENHDGEEEDNDDKQPDKNDENVERNDEDEAVTIEINSGSTRYISHKDATATLDVDEDGEEGGDEDDVDEDEDGNIINDKNKKKKSKSNGVMREVLKAVQDRIKYEESPK